MTNIVKNESNGYGYKYASLADIASQGYEIPKMKVVNFNDTDYVYYYDKETKTWEQGSRVVVPTGKGINEAQLYGSALTYARRYTVLLALGLACDDDVAIDGLKADETKKKNAKATNEQIKIISTAYDEENLQKILDYYKVKGLQDLTVVQASEIIKHKKESK